MKRTSKTRKALLRGLILLFVFVPVLLPGFAERVDAANSIYWTDAVEGKIQRANLDGSGVEDLVIGLAEPQGIALDVAGGKMYWTEVGSALKIRRGNLDGSGVEDLVGSVGATAIALDVAGGKMYWTDTFVTGKIGRANLDGTDVENLVEFVTDREGIALDVAGGKMFLTNRTYVSIERANLDGSGVEDLVITGLGDPRGIALDVASGKMYWTEVGTHKIQRANLDGSGVEDLVTGLGTPAGIALDLTSGKMYWTDFGTHKIQRANLDGSGMEDLINWLSIPVGIALDGPSVVAVEIDIKPGSVPNSINPRSKGVIPVAILTTTTFDATSVDPTTVRFGTIGTEAAPAHSALEDIDGDGHTDVILQFNTQATGIQCGDTSASLTGETFSGQVIQGSDSINTVGCKADGNSQCEDFSGAAFGLCTAFCHVMKCASDAQHASQEACNRVENSFRQVTGTLPPCKFVPPPPGPNLQRCVCQDGTLIDLCAQVDCDSGSAQDVICGPVCASHGGEGGTGCWVDYPSCAVQ